MRRLLVALLLSLSSCASSPILGARVPEGQREVFRELKEEIPLGVPVRLVSDPTIEEWGYTTWDEEAWEFVLTIHPDADPEVVVHEWGHLMTWDAVVESVHGPIWGVAYARAYRAVIED